MAVFKQESEPVSRIGQPYLNVYGGHNAFNCRGIHDGQK